MTTINSQALSVISKLFDNTLNKELSLSEDATYKKVEHSSFSPSTGQFTTTTTDTAIKIIKKSFSRFDVNQSNGAIDSNDIKAYIKPVSGLELSDMNDDLITYDGLDYKIKSLQKHTIGSDVLAIEVQLGVIK